MRDKATLAFGGRSQGSQRGLPAGLSKNQAGGGASPSPARVCGLDRGLDRVVSRVLTTGLYAAVAFLLVGVVLALARSGAPVPRQSSLAAIPRGLAELDPGGFLNLGLLILLVTPAARVTALLLGFACRRLWLFSLLSLVVLGVMGVSAYLGLSGG